ncbi:MAG: flavin reductase family protein [Elusimicrobia bacterium]|nr:flavin reductase family protein [Elusimicrobiota bacterium]
MEFDPEKMPLPERYGLMIAVIQPRPIAWVSTKGKDGSLNLAPFSFFTGGGANPMTVCFTPVRNREGKKKDTLVNIEQTKEFVVSVATEAMAEKMNQTSADYPYGVSEFQKAGLTPLPSFKVKPPRLKESPVNLECRLFQTVSMGEGPLAGTIVIGHVVYIHIADEVWKNNQISHADLKAIGRLEGTWYTRVTDTFEMPRPKGKVISDQ